MRNNEGEMVHGNVQYVGKVRLQRSYSSASLNTCPGCHLMFHKVALEEEDMATCEDSLLAYWGWQSSSSEGEVSWRRPLASSLQTEEETATVGDVVGTSMCPHRKSPVPRVSRPSSAADLESLEE